MEDLKGEFPWITYNIIGKMDPMNRNVLCFPEVIGTISNEYREEDAMVSYIEISGQSTASNLTKNTPTYNFKLAAPPACKKN